jgi:hypothetical protein
MRATLHERTRVRQTYGRAGRLRLEDAWLVNDAWSVNIAKPRISRHSEVGSRIGALSRACRSTANAARAQRRTGAMSSEILVYRMFGRYSFNARDGGNLVRLALSDGYSVGQWLNGARLIVGRRVAVSVEQAIYHGFATVMK